MLFTVVLLPLRMAALGRLLDPTTFGVMAVILVVSGLAQVVGELGLSEATIQHEDPDRNELSTIYWLNLMSGALVYSVVFIFTPLISLFFKLPELRVLLPVSSLSFLVLPFGSQFAALLQKDLNFRYLSFVDVSSLFTNTLVSIVLAWYGAGVWSLVFGELSGVSLRTIILFVHGVRKKRLPSFYFSLRLIRGYLKFGLHRVGAMTINFFNSRVDQLVIGALLGPQALGYYSMSFNLVIQPVNQISPVLTKVAFPVFCRIKDDLSGVKNGYLKILRLLLSVNAPVLLGISVVSPVAIPLFLGGEWVPAVPVVQILCFYTLFRSVSNAGGAVVLAKGRADLTFYWNIAILAVVPLVISVVGWFTRDLITVSLSLCVLQLFFVFANYKYLVFKSVGPCFNSYMSSILVPTSLALIMAIFVFFAGSAVDFGTLWLNLSFQVSLGVVIYSVLFFCVRNDDAKSLMRIFR